MDARTGLDAGDREISIYSEDLELLSLFEGQDHRCLRFYHQPNARTTDFHFVMQPWWVKKAISDQF